MPHYSYLLFDADNTLFAFDAANRNAFHAVCRQCDIPDTDETFALYERCNNAMWAAFDRGECTKDFLVVERFRRFLEGMALDRDPALCNRINLKALGESTLLLPHAEEVCRTLSRTHRLYIVTNAVASVQRSRLHRSAVAPYITDAFISEGEKMREGVNEEVSDEEAAQKSMEYVYFSYTSTDESGSVTELTDEEKAKAKSTAETIAERAKAGEDFAAVAAELGTEVQKTAFDAKSTSPDAALIEAANALAAEGDVTGAIESDAGVYVAKLTSLLDREATDQKKASIIEERKQEQYDSLLKKWRKETDIKVDKKVWKKVDFEETGVKIITSEKSSSEEPSSDETK